MKCDYEVIDNFLDEEYFDDLVTLFTGADEEGNFNMPWYFQSGIAKAEEVQDNLFYMVHMMYNGNQPYSSFYKNITPLLRKLEVKCLLRIKANFYPNTHILREHPMHVDFHFPHSGAIFSLNTCDGYTKLKDGTKIDSVANRVLLFDSSEEHRSTTTTNVAARINININYIQEQYKE